MNVCQVLYAIADRKGYVILIFFLTVTVVFLYACLVSLSDADDQADAFQLEREEQECKEHWRSS